MSCSLCNEPKAEAVTIAASRIDLCSFCITGILDGDSLQGYELRRAGRYARRRYLLNKETTPFKRTEHHRANLRKSNTKYQQTPEGMKKNKARSRVWAAVRCGKLVRPETCEICHRIPPRDVRGYSGVQFHHTHGYEPENWFVGQWLCRSCHFDLEVTDGQVKPLKPYDETV